MTQFPLVAKRDGKMPYKNKLEKWIIEKNFTPGLHDVDVLHDDECAIWCGGECDCEPDIQDTPPERCWNCNTGAL